MYGIFPSLAVLGVAAIGISKVCGSELQFKNAIIAVVSPICVAQMLFILYLTIKDRHW